MAKSNCVADSLSKFSSPTSILPTPPCSPFDNNSETLGALYPEAILNR